MPPFSETADKTDELQWFAGEKLGFCAVKDDELVGLIDTTEDDGENFVSQGSGILNISGMFVREDYRGKGYAHLLVDAAMESIPEESNQCILCYNLFI